MELLGINSAVWMERNAAYDTHCQAWRWKHFDLGWDGMMGGATYCQMLSQNLLNWVVDGSFNRIMTQSLQPMGN